MIKTTTALLLASFGIAVAHDNNPSNDSWYLGLQMPNTNGASCCSLTDCHPVPDDEWKTTNNHYLVYASRATFGTDGDNQWHVVPDEKFLAHKDNPTGSLVICGKRYASGFTILCAVKPGGV